MRKQQICALLAVIHCMPPYAPTLLVSTGGNMTAADVPRRHEWSDLVCLAASANSPPIPYLLPQSADTRRYIPAALTLDKCSHALWRPTSSCVIFLHPDKTKSSYKLCDCSVFLEAKVNHEKIAIKSCQSKNGVPRSQFETHPLTTKLVAPTAKAGLMVNTCVLYADFSVLTPIQAKI